MEEPVGFKIGSNETLDQLLYLLIANQKLVSPDAL